MRVSIFLGFCVFFLFSLVYSCENPSLNTKCINIYIRVNWYDYDALHMRMFSAYTFSIKYRWKLCMFVYIWISSFTFSRFLANYVIPIIRLIDIFRHSNAYNKKPSPMLNRENVWKRIWSISEMCIEWISLIARRFVCMNSTYKQKEELMLILTLYFTVTGFSICLLCFFTLCVLCMHLNFKYPYYKVLLKVGNNLSNF